MKSIIFVFFLFFSFSSFSQVQLAGKVSDKETHKPIAHAVIYSSDYQYSAMTDEDGSYELSMDDTATIHFEQLAYHSLSISADSLSLNPNISLERNIYELKAVEISPIDAEELLNKAMQNLYEKEEKKKTRDYLCHSRVQTSNGGEREAYALFDATLKSVDLKRGKYKRDFRLTKLDRLKNENASYFYVKNKPYWIELFPQGFTVPSDLENYVCELQDKDENVLIMKLSPKRKDKKSYRYASLTINKEDSVLIRIESQSFPNSADFTTRTYRKVDNQIVNHYAKQQYAQNRLTGFYYLDSIEHLGTLRVFAKEIYDLSFRETVTFVEKSAPQKDQKKIKPYNYVLYEVDFPETKGFWKQYE